MQRTLNEAADRLVFHARRLKVAFAAKGVWRAAEILHARSWKANFNPNEPRVPAGVREGGQWTGRNRRDQPTSTRRDTVGSRRAGTNTASSASQEIAPGQNPGNSFAARLGEALPGVQLVSETLPPAIPPERPLTGTLRLAAVTALVTFISDAALDSSALGVAIQIAIEAAPWFEEYAPYVVAYFDAPKSFAELQGGVASMPQRGYEIHHVVERSAANDPTNPIPRFLINSRENLVRIPTLKHWELNSWYETETEEYGGLTPRQYLKGKDWLERLRVGEEGLRIIGVLKP